MIPFDTRVDPRPREFLGAFHSPAEVEALVARMDVVVTTRVHGMVHALKQGLPAVAVDPISGGAKIRRQAEAVGWPVVLTADGLSEKALHEALDYCLAPRRATPHARAPSGLPNYCRLRAPSSWVT